MVGVVGIFVRFYFKPDFRVSVQGLCSFLLPLVFSVMFHIITVHMKCLVHTRMFQTHDKNLKYMRDTLIFFSHGYEIQRICGTCDSNTKYITLRPLSWLQWSPSAHPALHAQHMHVVLRVFVHRIPLQDRKKLSQCLPRGRTSLI